MSQKIRVRRIVASFSGEGGPCAGETNADNPTLPACRKAVSGAPNYQRLIAEKPEFLATSGGKFLRKLLVAASALIPIVGGLVAVGTNAADNATFDESGNLKGIVVAPPPVTTRSVVGQPSIGVSTPTPHANFGDLFSFMGQVNPAGPSTPTALVSEPGESFTLPKLSPGIILVGSIIALILFFVLGRK